MTHAWPETSVGNTLESQNKRETGAKEKETFLQPQGLRSFGPVAQTGQNPSETFSAGAIVRLVGQEGLGSRQPLWLLHDESLRLLHPWTLQLWKLANPLVCFSKSEQDSSVESNHTISHIEDINIWSVTYAVSVFPNCLFFNFASGDFCHMAVFCF